MSKVERTCRSVFPGCRFRHLEIGMEQQARAQFHNLLLHPGILPIGGSHGKLFDSFN